MLLFRVCRKYADAVIGFLIDIVSEKSDIKKERIF